MKCVSGGGKEEKQEEQRKWKRETEHRHVRNGNGNREEVIGTRRNTIAFYAQSYAYLTRREADIFALSSSFSECQKSNQFDAIVACAPFIHTQGFEAHINLD